MTLPTRRRSPLLAGLAAIVAALAVGSAALAAGPLPGEPAGTRGEERVIVVLAPGADTAAEAAVARGAGVAVERTYGSAVQAFAATVSPAEERALAADPQVVSIVPDERIAGPDVLAGQEVPTGVSRVRGPQSPAVAAGGIGVDARVDADVAIFDTGIDPAHPDLVVAGGYNCTSPDRTAWADGYGHGTHVAGTVGARDDGSGVVGVAPGVRLWAVRILDAKGEGYLSWWLCGLDWIAAQNDPLDPARPLFEAVNMSVTRWGRDDGACGATDDDLLHQAVCRVVSRGITVVVAAANDSGVASKRVPAAYNEVITVSALADTDGLAGGAGGNACWSWGGYDVDDTFADFSNYGGDVDLIAPGKCILSTKRGGGYGLSSGTSMAAPLVTGAAALYKATRPDAPPSEVRWALQALGTLDWDISSDPDGRPEKLLDLSRLGPLGDFAPRASIPLEGLLAGEAGATWSIPLDAGRGPGFIEPITFSVASAAAPLGATLASPATLWGVAAGTTLTVTVPPATAAGTYEVVVGAAYRATRVHELRLAVIVENAPPMAAAPAAAFVRGTRTGTGSVPLRLAWAPAADQSAIRSYELGQLDPGAPGGTEPTIVAGTSGSIRTATRSVAFGAPRAWAVRATDAPGNTGAWAVAAPTRVAVVQESSAVVERSRGWTGEASPYALGGKATSATRAGTLMRHTFTGRGIALIGPKGPTRGSAEIRLDGALVATVSARASTAGSRWVLYAASVDPAVPHTIEVRVLGTAGHPRFDVDAFLVLQ